MGDQIDSKDPTHLEDLNLQQWWEAEESIDKKQKSVPSENLVVAIYSVRFFVDKYFEQLIHRNPEVARLVAQKVKRESQERLDEYKASKFGFIRQFFSACKNLFKRKAFASSDRFYLNWANKQLERISDLQMQAYKSLKEKKTKTQGE
jgi:hypothetical protein